MYFRSQYHNVIKNQTYQMEQCATCYQFKNGMLNAKLFQCNSSWIDSVDREFHEFYVAKSKKGAEINPSKWFPLRHKRNSTDISIETIKLSRKCTKSVKMCKKTAWIFRNKTMAIVRFLRTATPVASERRVIICNRFPVHLQRFSSTVFCFIFPRSLFLSFCRW